ncbi:uncharacterized UDP-glucosyltransferase YdhE-like [Panonychus citri]|uniref:uncharacterized UDP-glucosyltransferase YdhE-like n=1 Tax=Panonychus citri TaxID=50023 RepID=UPI0023072118|nr:uncharacterized UDP-glucosyltransferase YdhE-like [Panonychus citri]
MSKTNERPLKILITSMISVGHLNACLGIGLLLHKRGHDVYFAHYLKNRSVIESNGMKFISLSEYNNNSDYIIHEDLPRPPGFFKSKFDHAMKFSPLEMIKDELNSNKDNVGFLSLLEASIGENYSMLNIIDQLKPDVCLTDYLWVMPWMVKVNIPVVPIMSTSPNDLYNGPPLMSGYSINSSPQLWKEYNSLRERSELRFVARASEIFSSFGVEYVPRTYAKQLGIYIYPGPLDYKELGPPMKPWMRLDSAIRLTSSTEFVIPDKLKDGPGKLVYVSMGTLASTVPEMMNMMISALSKSPHRFIISTGPFGDSYKLYDNMWGDKYLDQVSILPKVDLFITHGGSNSLIESLTVGKPLLVIPQFGDQLANGQRIVDLKLGDKINLWEFNEEKLVEKIDLVLNDDLIRANVARVAEELKKSDSTNEVCSAIENLARAKEPSV